MEQVPFVDTHIHFWDRPHPILRWDWLEPGAPPHPDLGETPNLTELKTYAVEEFTSDIEGCGVTKAVHVQAAIGTEDPVEETQWLQGLFEATGWPTGIIGDASLQEPGVEEVLERHTAHDRFRGVRDFGEGDYLVDPAFHRGFALLEKYGLVFDLDVGWPDMAKAAALARQFEGVPLVVDHTGFPKDRTAEYFHEWRKGMKEFESLEHVMIKISGLGMGDQIYGRNWSIDTIRPWVEASIEIFGVSRSFFGTNFPVDRMYSSYADLISAYREIVSQFNESEQHALLHGNAERFYRI